MVRDWYNRPLFLFLVFYIILIIILTPFLLNEEKPQKDICGYVVSYPYKYGKNYNFYLKSQKSYYLIKSDNSDFFLYDYICFKAESIKRIETKSDPIFSSWERYLNSRNVFYEIKLGEFVYIKKSNFILEFSGKVRNKIKKILKDRFSGDEMVVISGIFLGEKEEISRNFKDAVINSGAMHLLVASGSNVAYAVWVVGLFFGFFGFKSKFLKLISFFIVLIYVFLIGFDPPITRAFIMFSTALAVYAIKRNIDIFQILVFSAFLMITLDHLIIYDRGFLLSILSVYGIITGYNLYEKYFKPEKMIFLEKFNLNKIILYWLNKIISMLLITFFAQISILPVLIKSFHKVSLISLFSNLFLIPISAAIMAIVPAGVLLNEYVWASDIIFYALKLLTKLFIKLCYLFSSLPYSFVYISFRNELNFAFVSAMIFIFLNLPIINIKSSLARSLIWFVVIGFVFSFMWKDKKFGVFEFENYSVKGYLVLKPQGAYLINPVITAEKIISAAFDCGFDKIDGVMIGSSAAFRKKEIEKIKDVFKVERIYAPLWKCSKDLICVFARDKADIFEVKFKNDYGYFDDKTKLLFCHENKCY